MVHLRRLRQNSKIRELVTHCRVSVDQMIQPLFVLEGLNEPKALPGLTGVNQETSESIFKTIESDLQKGVSKFLLFFVPALKSEQEFSVDFATKVIQSIKRRFGSNLFLMVDVCLCSHTVHGHCGVLASSGSQIDSARSVSVLTEFGLSYAQAGADGVAPSDMMDGRIGSIRQALDRAALESTLIMSYAAKFHSRFYGPFRQAAECAPQAVAHALKDRSTYQIDPAFPQDAYLSALRDAEEGADILMVKPGLPYLDILFQLSQKIQKPWAVYQVSGEYASIELMAQQGWMDGPAAHQEAWIAMVRAGASMIITYGARRAQEILKGV